MTLEELTLAKTDVEFFCKSEESPSDLEYWHALLIVCDHQITFLTKKQSINATVLEKMNEIVNEKSLSELASLKEQVEKKLRIGGAIDVEYWEGLIGCIKSRVANMTLTRIHQTILEKRLLQLQNEKETQITQQVYAGEEFNNNGLVTESFRAGGVEGFREEVFMKEASKLMEIDEEEFNANEINMDSTVSNISYWIIILELSMAR